MSLFNFTEYLSAYIDYIGNSANVYIFSNNLVTVSRLLSCGITMDP